ncbi:MAG: ABC transporter ATP-binding protein [Candidatus Bathycorpusculaceae bacterium]
MKILAKDLIKIYRLGSVEVQALRGLNMEVKEGEMVSIIGPSGSGKTTLLNIIGGLDQATGGYVQVGDTIVTTLHPSQLVEYRRKTVGHIFQTLNLIPTLTAAENIELPMIALGVPREKRNQRVKELLEIVGFNRQSPPQTRRAERRRTATRSHCSRHGE